jgi:hypothetical protein
MTSQLSERQQKNIFENEKNDTKKKEAVLRNKKYFKL